MRNLTTGYQYKHYVSNFSKSKVAQHALSLYYSIHPKPWGLKGREKEMEVTLYENYLHSKGLMPGEIMPPCRELLNKSLSPPLRDLS